MNDIQEYKVLARKYRPQKFADLIGQESLVAILSNAIVNNRIAHAYVLTGVRGVGKTTTARLIAMSLNCQKRESKSFEPCGSCESCVSIRQDRNLDVIEIDAASKTGVDDIREIIDHVKYKPINSTYKIFIIDEVHMLSKNAFNALLKTLEEPPEHVKFIFATTEVKKIPITILSRCQRFDLHRIENKLLTSYLFKVSELEKINIEQDAMTLIVRAADGSVRDGLSLLDQAIANQNESISANQIIDMLGLADRGKIFDLLNHIFQGNAIKALQIYNELHQAGADIIMIFDEMLNAAHFITEIKIAPNLKEDIHIPELERERGVILQEIGMYLDDPAQMVVDYWQSTAFPNQPIGRLIIGKKEIIKSIQKEKIIEFMKNLYNPKKMVVSAAGKINHNEFVEKISNSMMNLPQGKVEVNERIKASYSGGEFRAEKKLEQVPESEVSKSKNNKGSFWKKLWSNS